jgi:hypothetical protein
VHTRLVERARDGDDDAFEELVDLDGDRCYTIAYRIIRDVGRAEDAVQQAFLIAWRELPRLREPERFEVWLHRSLSMPVMRSCAGTGVGAVTSESCRSTGQPDLIRTSRSMTGMP